MSTCIICLNDVEKCHTTCLECDNIMCDDCNDYICVFIKTNRITLPIISTNSSYIYWTCKWDCLYKYSMKYTLGNSITIAKFTKNKQLNILQQIQLPPILSIFLPKNITNMVMEYSEYYKRLN